MAFSTPFVYVCLLLNLSFGYAGDDTTLSYARFKSFNAEDGLSASRVLSFVQDTQGLIWIGSDSGVDRYDGKEVTHFGRAWDDANGLDGSFFRAMLVDREGDIWIGSMDSGLYKFNTMFQVFEKIPPLEGDFDNEGVFTLSMGKDRTILVGTIRSGLRSYDPVSNHWKQFPYSNTLSSSLPGSRINRIVEDSTAHFWVASHGGLSRYSEEGELIDHFSTLTEPATSSDEIWDIIETSEGNYWMAGTKGVDQLDLVNRRIQPIDFYSSTNDKAPTIRALMKENNGDIWLGSNTNGIYRYRNKIEDWQHFKKQAWQRSSLSSNRVWKFFKDRAGLIWIAGDAGVNTFNPLTNQFFAIGYYPEPALGLKEGVTYALTEDETSGFWISTKRYLHHFDDQNRLIELLDLSEHGLAGVFADSLLVNGGTLWIGMSDGSLYNYVIHTNQLKQILPAEGLPITVLEFSKNDELWIARYGWGVERLNLNTNELSQFPAGLDYQIKDKLVGGLLLDNKNRVWIGTYSGLHRYDPLSQTFRRFYHDPEDERTLSSNRISGMTLLSGELWVSTSSGLNKVIESEESGNIEFLRLGNQDKQLAQPLGAILKDKLGVLWIGSSDGFVRYDPVEKSAITVSSEHGLPLTDLMRTEITNFSDGSIIVRPHDCLDGICAFSFDPVNLKYNLAAPEITLVEVSAQLRGSLVSENLFDSDTISLPHKYARLKFRFVATDYASPERNLYQYKLDGWDSDWQEPSTNNVAYYTNLPAGSYQFSVRASNSDEIWSENAVGVSVKVIPAWWASGLAFVLYVVFALIFLIMIVVVTRNKLTRERLRNKSLLEANEIKTQFVQKLESEVAIATDELRANVEALHVKNIELHASQQQALESSKVKTAFLANMSHDLRTPLTGILGYTELLETGRLEDGERHYVKTIRQSANNLISIVNDILDVSKIESGKLVLSETSFDIRFSIGQTLALLAPIAYRKKLEICLIVALNVPAKIIGDETRIKQIVTNLVGNAIKFTEKGGVKVGVSFAHIADGNGKLTIEVIDTGIGISAKAKYRLFSAFEQANASISVRYGGTGLGLLICKKLADLMHGSIDFSSQEVRGSRFIVNLLLKAEADDISKQSELEHLSHLTNLDVAVFEYSEFCQGEVSSQLEFHGYCVSEFNDPSVLSETLTQRSFDVLVVSLDIESQLLDSKVLDAFSSQKTILVFSSIDQAEISRMSDFYHVKCISRRDQFDSLVTLVSVDSGYVSQSSDTLSLDLDKKLMLLDQNIIVADDNDIVRHFIDDALSGQGANIFNAENGQEALELAIAGKGEVIIMDTHMPGLDGLEATRKIRQTRTIVQPVIIGLSANVLPKAREAALDAGMDAYLVKPAGIQEMIAAIVNGLANHKSKRVESDHSV